MWGDSYSVYVVYGCEFGVLEQGVAICCQPLSFDFILNRNDVYNDCDIFLLLQHSSKMLFTFSRKPPWHNRLTQRTVVGKL